MAPLSSCEMSPHVARLSTGALTSMLGVGGVGYVLGGGNSRLCSCRKTWPPPATVSPGSPKELPAIWRGARSPRCRRWSAWHGGAEGRPGASVLGAGVLGPLRARGQPGSVSVRPVEGGWGQAEAVFAKITKWQISVGLGSRVA